MGISFWHIIIVLVVVLLLFGAGKIPRLMKDLGSGITAFKKGLKENEGQGAEQPPAAQPATPQIPPAQPAAAEKKPEEAVRRT
jgi:sec-independent protein translocase protein TatA